MLDVSTKPTHIAADEMSRILGNKRLDGLGLMAYRVLNIADGAEVYGELLTINQSNVD